MSDYIETLPEPYEVITSVDDDIEIVIGFEESVVIPIQQ